MDRLTSSIVKAKDVAELLPLMVTLSRRMGTLMGRRQLSEGDVQQLAGPLAQMRVLLTALAAFERSSGADAEGSLAGALAERFLELEGRIKELRNDLARQRSLSRPGTAGGCADA